MHSKLNKFNRLMPALVLAALLIVTAPASAGTLAGYWTFDGGNANDWSGNGNNGVFVGDATTTTSTVAGAFSTHSLALDGSGDYVTVAHSASLAINDHITVSLWLKGLASAQPAYTKPITKNTGSTTNPGWELQQQNTGDDLRIRIDDATSGNQVKGSNTLGYLDDEWHHIAFTLSAGQYRLYADGDLTDSGTYNHVSGFGNLFQLVIGAEGDGTPSFNGFIDEVAIYSVALDETLIDQLAAGVNATVVPAPAALPAGLTLVAIALTRRRHRR